MDPESEPGLMPQIQALIAPPPSEAPSKAKRKEVERRRGKGQNRDTCDACGDCGNLICCDKCPAAIHLQCQDPPLEEDDVPLGEWLCRVCRAKTGKSKDKKCLDELTPMQMLMKAATEQNPSMFDIPNSLKFPMAFPGSDKEKSKDKEKEPKRVATRRGSAAKRNAEPTKLCFTCRKGVRISPLINCDYCSSSFHLDCLNPPLTTPPSGTTWMCPNHPEHFLDSFLLQTTSGVERVKLWEKAAKEVDEHATKLEFLRKVSRKNPPFKYKVNLPERQKAHIPSSVVEMYKHPIGLVPDLPNHLKYTKSWKVGETPTNDEMEEFLKSLISMQVHITLDVNKKFPVNDTVEEDHPKSADAVEDMMEQMFNAPKKNSKLNRGAVEKFCSQLESVGGAMDVQISKIDPRIVKLLAIQRLQQLLPNFKSNNSLFNSNSVNPVETKVKVKETPSLSDVYAAFDENLFLKNGVVCTKKKYVALKDVNGDLKVEEWNDVRRPVRSQPEDSQENEKPTKPAARAALAPIGPVLRVTPVAMRFRTLTIGTNPDSDVCLTDFGSCHFTSPKHAVIFFDTMTGEYELLNYSSHGTIVDGCLYCIDSTQCRVPSAASISDPLTQSVRAMLDKRRGVKRESPSTSVENARVPVKGTKQLCGCQERISDPTGWEGSAILYHCSHLQFGCLQFVFSIVDFAPGKNLLPGGGDRKKKKVEENGEESSAIKDEVVDGGDGKNV